MVRIKINKKKFIGEIISEDHEKDIYGKLLVRYKLPDGKHTTGWFKKKDIENVINWSKDINNDLRITNNYRYQCCKCGYSNILEEFDDKKMYFCPSCNGKEWKNCAYIGTY